MKKLIGIFILTIFILTGCRTEEPIVFEGLIVLGFEVGIKTRFDLVSDVFTTQGHLIEDEFLYGEQLMALLSELDIDMPESPAKEFTFLLELISYEFYHETDDSEDAFAMPTPRMAVMNIQTDEMVMDHVEMISFPTITFEDAGIFRYQIIQLNGSTEDEDAHYYWLIDEVNVYFVVVVVEDEESESLVATVEKESDPLFLNVFTYDISEHLQLVMRQRWEDHVTEAYELGYEYLLNEEGEYERVAIYIPEPETEPATELVVIQTTPPTMPPPAQTDNNESGEDVWISDRFPEYYATWLSDSEALSYLALVNRNWRVSSGFSPGDLSVVNALTASSVMNNWIRMRATAARAMENMLSTAYSEAGHVVVIVSGYRSYATQTMIHQTAISNYGETQARRWSARPGHSEHQLGLAMDLSTFGLGGGLSGQFSSTPEGVWIRDNAHRFGFIVRYPPGRESCTGFIYEPWHLRFVGVDAATQIFNGGLILEEFLGVW